VQKKDLFFSSNGRLAQELLKGNGCLIFYNRNPLLSRIGRKLASLLSMKSHGLTKWNIDIGYQK